MCTYHGGAPPRLTWWSLTSISPFRRVSVSWRGRLFTTSILLPCYLPPTCPATSALSILATSPTLYLVVAAFVAFGMRSSRCTRSPDESCPNFEEATIEADGFTMVNPNIPIEPPTPQLVQTVQKATRPRSPSSGPRRGPTAARPRPHKHMAHDLKVVKDYVPTLVPRRWFKELDNTVYARSPCNQPFPTTNNEDKVPTVHEGSCGDFELL